MKAAVATGNQTYTAEVSRGAMSVHSRERQRKGRHLLSKALFFGMWAFYVVRKHTTVRHNKRSDGAIREALLTVREAQRDGSL